MKLWNCMLCGNHLLLEIGAMTIIPAQQTDSTQINRPHMSESLLLNPNITTGAMYFLDEYSI
jgi:hypothetical protein